MCHGAPLFSVSRLRSMSASSERSARANEHREGRLGNVKIEGKSSTKLFPQGVQEIVEGVCQVMGGLWLS